MNARLQYTDDDIDWLSERVAYYIRPRRKGGCSLNVPEAIDRAKADYQREKPQQQ